MPIKHLKIIPLLVIVAMLSFSIRLVEVASGVSTLSKAAIAAEKEPVKAEEETMVDMESAENKDDMDKDVSMSDEMMEDEDLSWLDAGDSDEDFSDIRMEMFADMKARRKALDAREKQLKTREALLQAAEQELERKYQELSVIRTDIENLLGKQSEEEKARIQSLVKIYEGMKAKEAARIFDTLDLDILVTVMGQMSERKLAPILASMNPERARTVTIMLAEQKKLPALPQ